MTAARSSGVTSDTAAATRTLHHTPTVVFFGTSLTAGPGLEPEQAYPALVEKLAAADGTPIKAINAGAERRDYCWRGWGGSGSTGC